MPLSELRGAANAATVHAVLGALGDRPGQSVDPSVLLRQVLGKMNLTMEQAAAIEMLLQMYGSATSEPLPPDSQDKSDTRMRRLESEVEDLRTVNDTLASALGACPICWGGDGACQVCGGEGRAGWASPDRDLFDELVTPAVRRATVDRMDGAARFQRRVPTESEK